LESEVQEFNHTNITNLQICPDIFGNAMAFTSIATLGEKLTNWFINSLNVNRNRQNSYTLTYANGTDKNVIELYKTEADKICYHAAKF
jgi:hypothetical protein